eukprot:scaffold9217_cov119-Isochrysis_galbana.AAC.3
MEKKLRERVEGRNVAPRRLRMEPMEVDSAADKGAKRVRVNSTEVSSTQVQNSARAIASKTPSGVAAPPVTTTAQAVHYNTRRGSSNPSRISDSFVKLTVLSQTTDSTYSLTTIHLTEGGGAKRAERGAGEQLGVDPFFFGGLGAKVGCVDGGRVRTGGALLATLLPLVDEVLMDSLRDDGAEGVADVVALGSCGGGDDAWVGRPGAGAELFIASVAAEFARADAAARATADEAAVSPFRACGGASFGVRFELFGDGARACIGDEGGGGGGRE